MPSRSITLPPKAEMRKKLLAVDKELAMFAPYLIPWAGEVVRSPWKLVAIIEAAIEQCVEGAGSMPATRGALVHFSPEIVEALAGKNGFSDEVKKDLKEMLEHIGRRR